MQVIKKIKKISNFVNHAEDIPDILDKILMLNGREATKRNKNKNYSNINEAEFQVYSQWGEDGIIDYLIERISREKYIPNKFIELGVENYTESNTRFLLKNRNWTGLVVDGSDDNIKYIKQDSISWRYELTAFKKFITAENVDGAIIECGFSGEIGLLSIDLDGNDYFIWDAIKSVSPIIVICEYNALFGDIYPLTIPYKDDFIRSREHFSNLYFGASINALIRKGKEKGYCFLGSCSSGVNAFFIRSDYFSIFDKELDEYPMYPSKCAESRDYMGQLNFLRGEARINQIKNMEIVKIDSNCILPIGDLSNIYSLEWSHGYKSKYLKKIDGAYLE
jgi:hypothetical protein